MSVKIFSDLLVFIDLNDLFIFAMSQKLVNNEF